MMICSQYWNVVELSYLEVKKAIALRPDTSILYSREGKVILLVSICLQIFNINNMSSLAFFYLYLYYFLYY